jgi:hypothetical protein
MGGRKPPPSRDEWRVFGWWAVVGIGSIWATWTLLSYGWVIAVITTVGAVGLANREEPGRSAWGFVTGMGVVPVWIGWVNRGADTPALSPSVWIWSGAGVALLGVLIFVRPRRMTPAPEDPARLG